MPETNNESALEMRLKQITKYMTIGLLSILVLVGVFVVYLGNAKQNESIATQNQQIQAQAAIDSDICRVYPDQNLCIIAREITQDPSTPVSARDGKDGKDGKDGDQGIQGRGVSTFTVNNAGDLIVSYSDGKTENVGRVVGQDGAPGIDGRGVLAAELQSGSLVIRYTDGSSQNLGIVVGPAGAQGVTGESGTKGDTGATGAEGPKGADGISVLRVYLSGATIMVEYSNGTSEAVGDIILTTIASVTCTDDYLTVTMTDGKSAGVAVDCTPDAIIPTAPVPNPSIPEPAPSTPVTVPETETIVPNS